MATRIVKLEIAENDFQLLLNSGVFTGMDYKIKEIEIKDDFFKDDVIHSELKKKSTEAYKQMKVYEFNKRNK